MTVPESENQLAPGAAAFQTSGAERVNRSVSTAYDANTLLNNVTFLPAFFLLPRLFDVLLYFSSLN